MIRYIQKMFNCKCGMAIFNNNIVDLLFNSRLRILLLYRWIIINIDNNMNGLLHLTENHKPKKIHKIYHSTTIYHANMYTPPTPPPPPPP